MGDCPVTVMCPILRPAFVSALSYQCTLDPGVESARLTMAMASARPASPSAAPRILIMAAAGTRMRDDPSGSPSTARTCCSNWLTSHASVV